MEDVKQLLIIGFINTSLSPYECKIMGQLKIFQFNKLIRTGKKPLLLGFCCWLGISVVSLVLQVVLGIW